jgi:hypothetical protein
MAQVVSCWSLTVDAQVQPQASPRAIRGEQIGTGTYFSLGPSMFHPHFICH